MKLLLPAIFLLGTAAFGPELTKLDEHEFKQEKARLRSSDKWERKTAVDRLARMDRAPAWELLIEALEDRCGEVADTAQFHLAAVGMPDLARRLLDRDLLAGRDPWTARRCAEIVGRRRFDGRTEDLLRGMGNRDAEVRRMLVWSVQRLVEQDWCEGADPVELADGLERLLKKERDDATAARALQALIALDATRAVRFVRAFADHRSARRRIAAVEALASLEREEQGRLLRRLAHDAERAVRVAVIQALVRLRDKQALETLIECLEGETEERLRRRILEGLRGLTGRKHRDDPRPWRAWAQSLHPAWRGSEFVRSARLSGEAGSYVKFAGLPLRSKRLAFLIDLSGSIWNERPDGQTRKAVVDRELGQALQALTPDTRFQLIPYTAEPNPWKEGLVDASPKNVRDADRWFRARRDSGPGNFWDAALLAMQDPEVDTLVVLTDGAPTGGRRYHLELLVEHFLELNLTRKVALDVVLVDATRKQARSWEKLARETGGYLHEISLKGTPE